MSRDFDSFVRDAVSGAEHTRKFDPQREIATWQRKLDELFGIARDGLAPFIEAGTVGFTLEPFTMREQLLGSYEAQRARIVIGGSVAELKPIGTMIVGSRGRVDLIGAKGTARIVLVPADTVGFTVRIKQSSSSPEPAPPPVEEWRWKLTTPPPRIAYSEFSGETFKDALMEVIGGPRG
jgi:hypothetical protein